jgi:hypothetical protein
MRISQFSLWMDEYCGSRTRGGTRLLGWLRTGGGAHARDGFDRSFTTAIGAFDARL